MDLNTMMIRGRLGRDPESRSIGNGNLVSQFAIAVKKSWKNQNTQAWEESTTWINCTAWGKLAEKVRDEATKGSYLMVIGEFKTDSWDDKDTGKKVYRSYCQVSNVTVLNAAAPNNQQQQQSNDFTAPAEDDLPF